MPTPTSSLQMLVGNRTHINAHNGKEQTSRPGESSNLQAKQSSKKNTISYTVRKWNSARTKPRPLCKSTNTSKFINFNIKCDLRIPRNNPNRNKLRTNITALSVVLNKSQDPEKAPREALDKARNKAHL